MSIPKEPRQLMINIMYLVLTAMLALNVSAEIINAFFLINRGIVGSNQVFTTSNEFTYTTLEKNASQDMSRYGRLVEAGKKIQNISKDFTGYIDGVRDELVGGKEGNEEFYYAATDDKHPGQPKNYKNKDITTNLLVNKKRGDEIEQKVVATRKQVLDVINSLKGAEGTAINEKTLSDLEKSITLGISDDWKNAKPKRPSWSHFTFNQMPVAAVFPIMSKFQNDMKSSESAVLNFLAGQVGATAIKVDAFIPIASAEKSYIIAGDTYNAEITAGASSKSVSENMSIRVNGSALKVENGVAKFSASPSTPGIQNYTVDITLTNPTTGKTESYKKQFSYEVGRRSVAVAADKMNVFYIGVDNPVTVSAAGVSSNDLRVSGSGGGIRMSGSGSKYTVNVTQQGDARISVSGGGLTNTNFTFRVKRIPNPTAKLSGRTGGQMGNGEFKVQDGIAAILDNFDFEAKCQIQGYELVYVPKREDAIPSNNPGPRYNEKSRRLVERAKPGDVYFFNNVKAKCPGDTNGREINNLSFTIK